MKEVFVPTNLKIYGDYSYNLYDVKNITLRHTIWKDSSMLWNTL